MADEANNESPPRRDYQSHRRSTSLSSIASLPPPPTKHSKSVAELFARSTQLLSHSASQPQYEIARNPAHLTLSIHPLMSQFYEFANIAERKTGDLRIDLYSIEGWFRQAKIFEKLGGARISMQDVKSVFYRMAKESLSYAEFETFIEALADFRKMHPDSIVYRLRLGGSPELEARIVHVALPEGAIDRLVDSIRDSARHTSETFYDTSREAYVEPICRGGVRRRFREEQIMFDKNVARMEKARQMENAGGVDLFKQNFVYFAKDHNFYSDGRQMNVTCFVRWLRQAGIIDGDDIHSSDVVFLFKKLYSLDQLISHYDVVHFLTELSFWKYNADESTSMIRKLRNCGPPARSSITIVQMEVPEDVVRLLTETVVIQADEFYDSKDLYIPTSADTVYGHTQKSRDRFFQNDVEGQGLKISHAWNQTSKQLAAEKEAAAKARLARKSRADLKLEALKKTHADLKERKGQERTSMVDESSQQNRGKGMYSTQRWSEAYPFGGHEGAYKQVRIDPDLLRYLSNFPDRQPSREDIQKQQDMIQKKEEMREKFGLAKKKMPSPLLRKTSEFYVEVPLEEQFELYSSFGHDDKFAGISRENTARWFLQAHLIDNVSTTKEDLQEIEHHYFRNEKHIPLETFQKLIQDISNKKNVPVAEIQERLSRCGPPREDITPYKAIREGGRKSTIKSTGSRRKSSGESYGEEREKRFSTVSNLSNFEDSFEGDPELKALFGEYARFGETSVASTTQQPLLLSVTNVDKWFKQTKLLATHKLSPADPNIYCKQLFGNAPRITYLELYELLDAIATAKKVDMQIYVDALKEAGPPKLTSSSSKHPTSEVYDRIRKASTMSTPIATDRKSSQSSQSRRKSEGVRIVIQDGQRAKRLAEIGPKGSQIE